MLSIELRVCASVGRTMPSALSVFGFASATKLENTSGKEEPAAMSVAPVEDARERPGVVGAAQSRARAVDVIREAKLLAQHQQRRYEVVLAHDGEAQQAVEHAEDVEDDQELEASGVS